MKTALEEAGEDVRHYYALWKAAEKREARLQEALLTRTVWLNIWHLEALRRVHPDDSIPRPTVEDYDEARRQLREDGLL